MPIDRLSAPPPHGAVRLSDWGLIRAIGDDARAFLHGQLTQDITGLIAGTARLAGYCSAKGRLLASFTVWTDGDGSVLLACSADVLPAVMKRLSMFVLRAKCRLSDASADVALWGLAGDAATARLGDTAQAAVWSCQVLGSARLIRLPDAGHGAGQTPRWLLAQDAAAAVPLLPALDGEAWRWLEVHSGVARIVAATAERFVPQMVNLDLVGGVNFQKGCYPGQEIVARSQYRGTLKRRAMVFHATEPLQPGQEIFHSDDPGQPAGLVALAGSLPDSRCSALAEVKLAALDGGTLHAGSPGGPLLRQVPLPYAIPAEQG